MATRRRKIGTSSTRGRGSASRAKSRSGRALLLAIVIVVLICVVYGAYAQSTGPVQKLQHLSVWVLDKLFAKSAQVSREVTPVRSKPPADPGPQAIKVSPDSTTVQAPDTASKQPVKAAPPRPAHRLVIVIDDCGYNELILRELAALDLKLTYSFLPDGSCTPKMAAELSRAGHSIMLHMPMEPLASDKLALEPSTLRCGMAVEQLENVLEQAFAKVPQAEGLNNHMGSKATCDQQVTETLARFLRNRTGPSGKPLFLLDSMTTPSGSTSLMRAAALRFELPFRTRDVFLDDELDPEAMTRQAEKAIEIAKRDGEAILIGHARRETLEWLRINSKLFQESDVTLMSLTDAIYGL